MVTRSCDIGVNMIEIKYQIEHDTGNTIETKTFTRKIESDQIDRDELFKDFNEFLAEYFLEQNS